MVIRSQIEIPAGVVAGMNTGYSAHSPITVPTNPAPTSGATPLSRAGDSFAATGITLRRGPFRIPLLHAPSARMVLTEHTVAHDDRDVSQVLSRLWQHDLWMHDLHSQIEVLAELVDGWAEYLGVSQWDKGSFKKSLEGLPAEAVGAITAAWHDMITLLGPASLDYTAKGGLMLLHRMGLIPAGPLHDTTVQIMESQPPRDSLDPQMKKLVGIYVFWIQKKFSTVYYEQFERYPDGSRLQVLERELFTMPGPMLEFFYHTIHYDFLPLVRALGIQDPSVA